MKPIPILDSANSHNIVGQIVLTDEFLEEVKQFCYGTHKGITLGVEIIIKEQEKEIVEFFVTNL